MNARRNPFATSCLPFSKGVGLPPVVLREGRGIYFTSYYEKYIEKYIFIGYNLLGRSSGIENLQHPKI